jgi:hypothetical protein
VVVLAVLLPSTAWCISHPGVSYVDHNNNRIGAIAHNSSRGNFSNNKRNSSTNSNSLTMLLPHHRSRLPSGHHNSFPPATFHASTVERLLENAICPSKATRRELWHPWSISIGAIKSVMHNGRLVPTTPPWRRFPQEKKC